MKVIMYIIIHVSHIDESSSHNTIFNNANDIVSKVNYAD